MVNSSQTTFADTVDIPFSDKFAHQSYASHRGFLVQNERDCSPQLARLAADVSNLVEQHAHVIPIWYRCL